MFRRNKPSNELEEIERYIVENDNKLRKGEMYASLSPDHIRFIHFYMESHKGRKDINHLIKEFVENLQALVVSQPKNYRGYYRKEINLTHFTKLTSLIVVEIKPTLIVNLSELRDKLAQFIVRESLNSLGELLDFEIETGTPWRLETLNCSQNNIPQIDSSTSLIPEVVKLDLSHNIISKIENLTCCVHLEVLNLSFNRISSLENIHINVNNIQILSLRHNQISKVEDLVKLYSLVKLDLSHNLIGSITEVSKLHSLPLLNSIWLSQNPIDTMKNYRWKILKIFAVRNDNFTLDGLAPTELEIPRLIIAKRRVEKQLRLTAKESPQPQIIEPIDTSSSPITFKKSRVVDIANSKHSKKQKNEPSSVLQEICEDWESYKNEVENLRRGRSNGSWLRDFHSLQTSRDPDLVHLLESKGYSEEEEEELEEISIGSENSSININNATSKEEQPEPQNTPEIVSTRFSKISSDYDLTNSASSSVTFGDEENESTEASELGIDDIEKVCTLSELDQVECNLSRTTIPQAMQLYFNLKIFSTNEEYFVYLLRCSFVLFEVGSQKEKVCLCLLSNQNLYILLKEEEPKIHFSLIEKAPLSSIKHITIGLFAQWMRIRTENIAFVLITRHHQHSHEFREIFRETLLINDPVSPPAFVFCTDMTLVNMSYQFCKGVPVNDSLESYFMGYLCAKSSSYRGCSMRKIMKVGDIPLTPVSVIMINFPKYTSIFLCREEYSIYPKEGDCEESDGQFPVISEQKIDTILGLEIDSERPCYLSLCFDNHGSGEQTWDLFIPDITVKSRFIRIVSRLFQKIFNVGIQILEK